MNKTIQKPAKLESKSLPKGISIFATLSMVSLATTAILTNPVRVNAAIVWDNSPASTGATITPSPNLGRWTNSSSGQNLADQFLLGQDTDLTGMDIYTRFLGTPFNSPVVGQSVTIRLWNDNGGAPGTLLHTLTEVVAAVDSQGIGSDQSVSRAFASFTNPISVLGNTRYWIGMSGTTRSIGQVLLAGPNAPGDGQAAYFTGTQLAGIISEGDQAFRLYGSAAAIPTPALLPGLIGMGIGVWRKRKTAEDSAEA